MRLVVVGSKAEGVELATTCADGEASNTAAQEIHCTFMAGAEARYSSAVMGANKDSVTVVNLESGGVSMSLYSIYPSALYLSL